MLHYYNDGNLDSIEFLETLYYSWQIYHLDSKQYGVKTTDMQSSRLSSNILIGES